jgi:hypothetical protein
MRRVLFPIALVVALLVGIPRPAVAEDARVQPQGGAAQAQPAGQPPATNGTTPSPTGQNLPVSLERIRKGVTTETDLLGVPPVRTDLPRFYMEVRATPDFSTFLQGFDLVNGPVPYGGFTHQEFLNMVTPKELYSSAGFGALEVLQAGLMSKGVFWLAGKASQRASDARRNHEVEAARTRIKAELAAIQAARAQPPSAPDIGMLDWMTGCWLGGTPDHVIEEQWMAPRGGTLIGMSRTVVAGQTKEHEFLQIRQGPDGVFYTARPSGQAEASFKLVRGATSVAREVVFENLAHDFPQRIIYRLQPDGSLYARIEGTRDGSVRGVDFPMKPATCR